MRAEFLSEVLGLQGLYVTEVAMSDTRLDLTMGRDDGGCYVCSRCGQMQFVYHDRYRISPQDLMISGRNVYLHLWRHRIYCPFCQAVVNEHLPHVRAHSQMTTRLEQALHAECADTPVKAVAQRYALAWGTVRDVDLRLLREKVARQSLSGVRRIGIDEIAHEKGHRYLTIVTDLDQRKVVRILEERKSQSLTAFFKELGPAGCAKIECVVIDMWRPYYKAIRRHLKQAVVIIDKFHVIRAVHEALDEVRKDEVARLPPEERAHLKRARWLLLRALQNTQRKDKTPSLVDLLSANTTLAKGYILKEEFREWYNTEPGGGERNSRFLERVKTELRKWYRHVHESCLEPFEKVVKTIKRWRGAILNHFLTGLTNGLSEGINNVIKTIKKRAYGYRDKEYFALKIYQKVGLI